MMRRSGPSQSWRTRRLIRMFAGLPNVTRGHVATLRQVIDGSPLITWQLNEATRRDELHELEVLPATTHAGGAYDGDRRTISIPLDLLAPSAEPETAFVLGHELQHALGNATSRQQTEQFFEAAEAAVQGNHDYTPTIGAYLSAHRDDEAAAHLAGWNAMIDWVELHIPDPTIDDVVLVNRSRVWDFVDPRGDSFVIKPQLVVRPDLRFDLSPQNVAAMGVYYFDKRPNEMQLGFLGTSDYQNQYGSWAVSQAAACHRYFTQDRRAQPLMIINAARLGLSRRIMEENGIDLGGQPVQPYLDCSTSPPQLDFLHHTIQTHQYVPADQQPPARPAPDPSVGLAHQTCAQPPTGITRVGPEGRSRRPAGRSTGRAGNGADHEER